jgi:hypothetical protein
MKSLRKIAERTGLCVLFFATYLALNRLSYDGTPRPFAGMAWNPALGVNVAIVAWWGARAFPLVFIAPFVGALFVRGFPLTGLYTLFGCLLLIVKVFFIWKVGARISAAGKDSILKDRQTGLLLAAVPVTLITATFHARVLGVLDLMPHAALF